MEFKIDKIRTFADIQNSENSIASYLSHKIKFLLVHTSSLTGV